MYKIRFSAWTIHQSPTLALCRQYSNYQIPCQEKNTLVLFNQPAFLE